MNQDLPTVYLIPGFATDGRIFDVLDLGLFPRRNLVFEPCLHCKNLSEFAQTTLLPQIDTTKPFVFIGVSMGGMLSLELSKLCNPEAIILISSVKERTQMPAYIRLLKNFPIYKAVNDMVVDIIAKTAPGLTGIKNKAHAESFREMIAGYGAEFLKKQAQWCVEWNPTPFEAKNVFHIHGTLDEVFPIWNVTPDVKIKGGNHQMLYFKHKELSKHIQAFLEKKLLQEN